MIVVDDAEQEGIGTGAVGGGDNTIISGDGGYRVELDDSSTIWLSLGNLEFSSISSSSSVSHRLASSSSSLNDG